MAGARAQPGSRNRRYTWLLILGIALGTGVSLSVSYTLYHIAYRQWVERGSSDAQRLASMLLGWIEDVYSPLSGLAALVENSHVTEPSEFLNALDGIESRETTSFLGGAAMLEKDDRGKWAVKVSSGNFVLLDRDADEGFAKLGPLLEQATAQPNQFVLGPPTTSGDERLISPVLIALNRVKRPTVIVGKFEYETLQSALRAAPTPVGFYLTLSGKFPGQSQPKSIIRDRPADPVVEKLATRATTGGVDLEIVWNITKAYEGGPDYAVAATALGGGVVATLLLSLLVVGLLKQNRVINQRVDEATAALRQSGEEQTAILESATFGIAFVKDRVIVRANSRLDELFGFERGEQIGRPTRIWYPDDESHAAGGGAVYEALARGETHQREQLLQRKSGELFWCRLSGRAVEAADLTRGSVWILEDVTVRRQAEEEIRQARRKAEEATEMKSLFLANMSHEIRTPMNAIIGLSHLALKTPLNAKQRDYVSKVHNAGTSLLGIINDILDFSKIEAGRLDLETTDFAIDDVIGSVTTLTAQKAHDKGLEFLADVSSEVPEMLRGDPLRLGQVLTNLVNNAVKFTEQGEIRLTIGVRERTGDKVQLQGSVRDTGIGMTKEQAAKLFQPFTQADMSTTRKHGGTGLGLTIARRLVELMGGQIWLESEPGVGTTFHFLAWFEVSAARAAGRVVPDRLTRLRVLVVDDNAAAREILQEPLRAIVGDVDAVASGAEAVAAVTQVAATAPYDLVFMDWRMPGLDGLEASRRIKSDPAVAHQPAIVLVTAFGRDEVREEAERLHLDGFLVKPVTKSMIVDTLVNLFGDARQDGGAAGPAAEEQASRLRGARILLVEDNEINQQIAVELLEGAGATVRVAGNGREGVQALADGPDRPEVDVVLMDLQMPEMDGFQATAKLRADPRFATLPIIAMTAHATMEERQRCLAAGMNDHIAKPIDPSLLFATVGRYYQPSPMAAASAGPVAEASRPDAAAHPSGTADGALPSVDGLDVAEGLLRVAGNRSLYLKLLRQFAAQQAEAPARIAEAMKAGDHALAERLAHTVKGVAGNLGAKPVQTAAAALEHGIAGGEDAGGLEALRVRLAGELTALLDRLVPALGEGVAAAGPPTTPATADPQALATLAAEMRRQLSEFDPGITDLLESNRDLCRFLLGEHFTEFEGHIQGYAFGEAQALLERAATVHGIGTGT